MNKSFVHLHSHTEYSMLDGASRIKEYIRKVKENNQNAAAITDHGNLYGALEFFNTAKEEGINPIIGYEAYLTPGSRFDKPKREENIRYHLTILAENDLGYSNLINLASKAYTEGYYYKPRIDFDLLKEYSTGLIGLSGCLGGEVAQLLGPDSISEEGGAANERDLDQAIEKAIIYQELFGKENYFIEVMKHGIKGQDKILPDLLTIASEIGAPLVATNDCHYVTKDKADAHDALLCVQTNALIEEENRFRFDGEEYYVKTTDEMYELFPEKDFPDACRNTVEIADRVSYNIKSETYLLPDFPLKNEESPDEYLKTKVVNGAKTKYGDKYPKEVSERIEYELEVIISMGFSSYFLIVSDLIEFADSKGIRTGAGRGSSGGSIVSYCLNITKVDPLKYGLLFERFLNKGRRELPDIDMDFDERYRADVIKYAMEKYGKDRVAHIVTFATIKAKQAIRDAARVLGLPFSAGDKVAKLMPPAILGTTATIPECLNDLSEDTPYGKEFYAGSADLRKEYKNSEESKRIIDIALGLEGLRRQDGIHAAAVVISPGPITNYLPVQQKGKDAELVTQYEMYSVEKLGLLKMDFLGLRNLSIIDRCCELIQDKSLNIDKVSLDDQKTLDIFSKGNMIGIFQLESRVAQALARSLKPKRFEDIVALVALIRPGPLGAGMHTDFADRANGRKDIEYMHKNLEEILEETYGILIYQEQVMEIAQKIANFDLSEADDLRKAMGKKLPKIMEEQREKFVSGAIENGYSDDFSNELFEDISFFAGYGFNKSHSVPYALIAYQTAYLKAHYPEEYLSACLTSAKRDKDRTSVLLSEVRDMSLIISVPDINTSDIDFTVSNNSIVFGLSAIRNVGDTTAEKIVEERKSGKFKSVEDFISRMDARAVNKRSLEALIQGGAFDSFGIQRKALFESVEELKDVARKKNSKLSDQSTLFKIDSDEEPKFMLSNIEWEKNEKLEREKEVLGFFVSEDPLEGYGNALLSESSHRIIELLNIEEEEEVSVVISGMVSNLQKRISRRGNPWIQFDLQDLTGSVNVLLFNKLVDKYNSDYDNTLYLKVSGVFVGGGENVIRARDIQSIDPARIVSDLDQTPLRISVSEDDLGKEKLVLLKELFERHPGNSAVELEVTSKEGAKLLELNSVKIKKSLNLQQELHSLLSN